MTSRFFTSTLAMTLGLWLADAVGTSTLRAGDLVNDTKEIISVQKGTRHPQTGAFTWTHTIDLLPGNYVIIPRGQWYRHDSHTRDGKVTYSLPGTIEPNNGRFYFFLYGNQVWIDTTRK